MRDALAYCVRPEHLRRTIPIAIVVGIVLTAVNQLEVILAEQASAATWLRCGANFVVPLIVSNIGLLGGRDTHGADARQQGEGVPPSR